MEEESNSKVILGRGDRPKFELGTKTWHYGSVSWRYPKHRWLPLCFTHQASSCNSRNMLNYQCSPNYHLNFQFPPGLAFNNVLSWWGHHIAVGPGNWETEIRVQGHSYYKRILRSSWIILKAKQKLLNLFPFIFHLYSYTPSPSSSSWNSWSQSFQYLSHCVRS